MSCRPMPPSRLALSFVAVAGGFLSASTGCTPPIEAPEDLGDLTLYLFENFDAEGDELVAGMDSLEAYLEGVDMAAEIDDRAVTPPKLTSEHWGAVSGAPEAEEQLQVPVTVWAESSQDMTRHFELMTDPNQVCIQDDGTKYYGRSFEPDPSCFVDGSCDRLDTTNEVRFENLLAEAWLDTFADFRSVPAEDGRRRVVTRGWMEQLGIADDGVSSWDQRFSLDVWIPHPSEPDRTWRFLTSWGSVSIAGVGDDLYATMVKNGIDEIFQNGDAFLAGEPCDNDRDRPYDRND